MPDCDSVRLWREKFKLNLSNSWKRDVEKTITDLKLWKSILDGWFYFDAKGKKRTKHPGIKNLLTEYERLESSNTGNNETASLSTRGGEGLSTRSDCDMSTVRIEPPRLYFGTG